MRGSCKSIRPRHDWPRDKPLKSRMKTFVGRSGTPYFGIALRCSHKFAKNQSKMSRRVYLGRLPPSTLLSVDVDYITDNSLSAAATKADIEDVSGFAFPLFPHWSNASRSTLRASPSSMSVPWVTLALSSLNRVAYVLASLLVNRSDPL